LIYAFICWYFLKLFYRLEYEQNRDMSSRILELEASISALEKDLKRVQDREAAAKLAAEKSTEEVNQLKEEVKGIVDNCVCCIIYLWHTGGCC